MRDLVVDLRRSARSKAVEAAPEVPTRRQSRSLAWGLAAAVGIAAGLAGFVAHIALTNHTPQQEIRVQRLTDLVGLEETPALSPDGKTVAFVAVEKGRRQIWVRLLAGGTPLAITKDDADHYGPRWAPDSASLIYYTAGAIWEVPALGGTARKIVSALGPGDFSHDGKSLAYFRLQDGATELALGARDQSTARAVTKLSGGTVYSNLRWSPDDQSLAFQAEGTGTSFVSKLMVAAVSSGEQRQAAGGDVMLSGFAWIPDGSGLIVSSAQGSTMAYPPTYNVWTVPRGRGTQAQLSFGEFSYESPDVNPQGNLVLSRVRSQSDVWKFPVTGDPADNALRGSRITRQTGQVQSVTASPDESEVAFLSDNGGHANVWVARVSNGEMRPVTREFDPRSLVAVPYWSPRGEWINFLSNRNTNGGDVTLWLAKPDGSDARDLGMVGAWVCWSPDGNSLYYSTQEKNVLQIRKVPVAGGQPVTVRDDNAIGCAADTSTLYYARMPTQATAADFEIRAATPENGPSKVIGHVAGSRIPVASANIQPYLSPDGKWLAMPLLDGSTTNLWALPTSGGDWRKLTDFGARNAIIARRIAWSRDGKYMYASVSDVDSDIVMLSGLKLR